MNNFAFRKTISTLDRFKVDFDFSFNYKISERNKLSFLNETIGDKVSLFSKFEITNIKYEEIETYQSRFTSCLFISLENKFKNNLELVDLFVQSQLSKYQESIYFDLGNNKVFLYSEKIKTLNSLILDLIRKDIKLFSRSFLFNHLIQDECFDLLKCQLNQKYDLDITQIKLIENKSISSYFCREN